MPGSRLATNCCGEERRHDIGVNNCTENNKPLFVIAVAAYGTTSSETLRRAEMREDKREQLGNVGAFEGAAFYFTCLAFELPCPLE